MVYHISYDLKKPGKDYAALHESIKKLGNWCHPVDSTWYIKTPMTAEAIRDTLRAVMDQSDALIVTVASAPGAWFGLDDQVSAWLQNHL